MSKHLERMLAKAKGNFWDDIQTGMAPPTPDKKYAVRHDSFDKRAFEEIVDMVPALKRQMSELQEKYPTSPYAYEDLFNLLNQGDPRFHAIEEMDQLYRPQHLIMKQLDESEDLKWVRQETRYDDFNTALAMLTMQDRMERSFDEMAEAIEQVQQMMDALAEAIKNGEVALSSGEGMSEAEKALAEAMGAVVQAQGDAGEKAEAAGKALATGLAKAKDEIESQEQMASAYGVDKGQLQRMNYAERRALADRLRNSKLAKLAKLVGAFRMFGDAERRRRIKHAPSEVHDVTMGNDLLRLLPGELTNLAIPELEEQFWLRWAKGGLLQKEVRGPERAGQGPIIFVCDESGSMSSALDANGNSCEAWSKAVALSLCDQARRDKRDFTYIGFASGGEQWETTFPGGKTTVEGVMEFTEHFFGGGTEYTKPLGRAMEIIADYEKRSKVKPDIVFVTDADCQVPQEFKDAWNELKKRADVKCFGIQIGGSGYYNDMKDLVDRCITIGRENANPAGIKELFRGI